MVTFSVSSCTGEKQTLHVPDLEFLGMSCSRIVLSCSVVIMTVLSEDFLPRLGFPLFSGLYQQSYDAWFVQPQCVHLVSLDCVLDVLDLSFDLFLLPLLESVFLEGSSLRCFVSSAFMTSSFSK